MPWTIADIPDQTGRLALITGASSGLGLETARALANRGATVLLACRSRTRAEAARLELLATATGPIDLIDLDLADLDSVVRAAATVADRYGHLDLLINNAGVMGVPRRLTRQGFELQFGTNHLGHFALTGALLPLLNGRPDARVVTVTSGAQYFGRLDFQDLQGERRYDRWKAYSQSKLANISFALELQRRLDAATDPSAAADTPPQARAGEPAAAAPARILSLAAHPGLARTNLQPVSLQASGSRLEAMGYRLLDPLFQSAAMGALPQLFAATAPDVEPGGHYGPDQWGGLRGWPTPVRIAPAALDPDQGRRLWQVSQELVLAALPGRWP
ncbi:MAG: SDR family NAD(P)-dependent oxidoreductase [Cyanobacteriota bacterium]|nr:SDR family NAD(P)-dependent oxidoreductase [Cyanobacteriota bacterium]